MAESAEADRREAEAEIRDALDRLRAEADNADDDDYAYAARMVAAYHDELDAALYAEDAEALDELRSSVLAAADRAEHPPTAEDRARAEAEGIGAAVRLPLGASAESVLQAGRRLALMARLARADSLAERYGIADWRTDPAAARDALLAEAERLTGTLTAYRETLPPAEAERLARALTLASEVVAAIRYVLDRDAESAEADWREVTATAAAWTLAPLVEALRAVAGEAAPDSETVRTLREYAAAGSAAAGSAAAYDVTVTERPTVAAEPALPPTVELPADVTRAPIFASASHAVVQLALWTAGTLYRHPFRVLEPHGPLTVRDALLLAHLVRRYDEDGRPAHRRVTFSLTEACRWLGYSEVGGRQRRLIRDALLRMRAASYESVTRLPGGGYATLAYGLIDLGATAPTVRGVRGAATLSEPLAVMVADGTLVYLESDTFRRLVELDELAARLWVFLEGESGPGRREDGWHYPVFSGPEGEAPRETWTPVLADLLRIADWQRRRDVARRVRQAAAVLMAEDPRYRLTLGRAAGRRQRGMWTLYAGRTAALLTAETRRERRVLRDAQTGTSGRASGYGGTRKRVLRDARSRSETAVTSFSTSSLDDSLTRENVSETRRENAAAIAEAEAEGRPDLAELYRRTGWTRATPKVRQSLSDVAERHAGGYAWVADRLREAPEADRPSAAIRYVLDRDAEDRARRTAEAEAREAGERRDPSPAEAAALWSELRTRVAVPPAVSGPDRERRVAEWRRLIVGREVPAAAAHRAIAEYAPDLDDLAELL